MALTTTSTSDKLRVIDRVPSVRHALHAESMAWVEKNCYVDIWIELLHALGLPPEPALTSALTVDFEDDQWTFFKPWHTDLWDLYGIDVQELNVWRPLLEHAIEHLGAHKLISTEADSYWLPDTAGTDYRRSHVKTTIVLNDLDVAGKRLGYFHNAGYYELCDEDFTQLFSARSPADGAALPLFAEIIRIDRLRRPEESHLAESVRTKLVAIVARMPVGNPVARFLKRAESELAQMPVHGLQYYHAWAFANTRQLGAMAELAMHCLQWLQRVSGPPLPEAVAALDQLSQHCKRFILKGARATNGGDTRGLIKGLTPMIGLWDVVASDLRTVTSRMMRE